MNLVVHFGEVNFNSILAIFHTDLQVYKAVNSSIVFEG